MKKGIHPESYRIVVFKDMSDGTQFFSRSTANTKDTIEIDKKVITIDEAVKTLGEATATAKLHREVKAEIKLNVVAE